MGLGYALYERMIVDDDGAVTNATLRNYRIPAFADLPRNEIVLRGYLRPGRPAGREVPR